MEVAHDPKTKQQIKEAIYTFLYSPVKESSDRVLFDLISRNSAALRSPHECSFIYKGRIYISDPKAALPRKMLRLVPELVPEMEAYLAEQKELDDHEIPFVMGFVNRVLNSSNTFEDYLRTFPVDLHDTIKALQAKCPCKVLKLTDEEVHQIQQDNAASISLLRQRRVQNLII